MGPSTSRWSREELEEAFQNYQRAVIEVGKTWDWSGYADHFTEDAKYVEHAMGNMEGRENIREWIVSTMNTFPGSEMPVYPVEWYSIDTDKGWVIFKNVNTMKDPGDGSVHGAPVITVLEYAGDDKWSYERGRVQPDELRGDVAGLRSEVSRTGHTVRRREDVRQEHELGTDLTYYARAAEDWVRLRLLTTIVLTNHEVVWIGLTGPCPVVDQPPGAEDVHFPEAVLVERMLDRGL